MRTIIDNMKSRRRLAVARGAVVAALAAAVVSTSATDAAAQVRSCTAALDVDVHYCLNGNGCGGLPPVGTDPMALEVGDPVSITLEVTNDSQFQEPPAPPPPGNPPAGMLQGAGAMPPQNQAKFKIFYACSASTCNPGEVLPGVFTFNSATLLGDAVGNATFVDNGDGSGTLTINNDIPYGRGPACCAQYLVQLDLTVASRPPGNAQIVFARSNGSQAALLITDPDCLPGLTGTGEGSTAALFQPPSGNDLEFCQHPNKQVIRINTNNGGQEFTDSRVAFRLNPYDPSTEDLTFGYEHNGAPVFQYPTIPAGCFKFQQASPLLTYLYDPSLAPQCSGLGIQRARLQRIAPPDKWCLDFLAYGEFNLSLPDDRVMPITVETGGLLFAGPKMPTYKEDATWSTIPRNFVPPQLANQWYLPSSAWK